LGKGPGMMKANHVVGGDGSSGASRARFRTCQNRALGPVWASQYQAVGDRTLVRPPSWLRLELSAHKERLRAGCAMKGEGKGDFYHCLRLPTGTVWKCERQALLGGVQ